MMAGERGRHIRRAYWFVVLAGALVRYLIVGADFSSSVTIIAADVIAYLGPIALVFAGSAILVARTGAVPIERRFWGLLGFASGLLLLSEARWTWWVVSVDPHGPKGQDWSSMVAVCAAFVMLMLIVALSRAAQQPFVRRLGVYIDVLLAVTVLWPLVYLQWTSPLILSAGGSVSDAALLAVRTLIGLSVLAANLVVVAGWKSVGWRSWERLASAALALFGAGIVASPLWYAQHLTGPGYSPSAFTDVLGAAFALMGAAVVYRMTADGSRPQEGILPLPGLLSPNASRAYPVVVAAALPIFVYLVFRSIGGPDELPLEVATALLAGLLALRSWVFAFERSRARREAITDSVSGALSPILLEERLRAALAFAETQGREVSLLVFGLHELRRVADSHGYAEADAVLRRVAEVLSSEAPTAADVFRLGSEEFAVICPGIGSSEAAAYARRVWLRLTHGSVGDVSSGVDLAAGVATYPTHVAMWEDLLAAAEIARAAARVADADPVVIFEESVAVVPADEHRRRVRMRNLRATVRTLAEAVDARDPATRDHSTNVAELATALAQVLDLSDERVQVVGLAALMHDVGKIGVRDGVLLKGSALSAPERVEIEEHSVLGERILLPAGLDDIPSLVRSHHERWDGRGYPDGLAGEEIPVESRILAVCDAFETMTTGRTYRAAVSSDEALAEIDAMAGSQFDPAVAAAFIRMVGRLGLSRAAHDLGSA